MDKGARLTPKVVKEPMPQSRWSMQLTVQWLIWWPQRGICGSTSWVSKRKRISFSWMPRFFALWPFWQYSECCCQEDFRRQRNSRWHSNKVYPMPYPRTGGLHHSPMGQLQPTFSLAERREVLILLPKIPSGISAQSPFGIAIGRASARICKLGALEGACGCVPRGFYEVHKRLLGLSALL